LLLKELSGVASPNHLERAGCGGPEWARQSIDNCKPEDETLLSLANALTTSAMAVASTPARMQRLAFPSREPM
jgi:hypothetical protein